MGCTKRNKGKLIFVAKQPYIINHDFDEWFPDYVEINNRLYRVEFEIENEEFDGMSMCHVTINKDTSIDFDITYYHGGIHWIGIIDDEIKRIDKEE